MRHEPTPPLPTTHAWLTERDFRPATCSGRLSPTRTAYNGCGRRLLHYGRDATTTTFHYRHHLTAAVSCRWDRSTVDRHLERWRDTTTHLLPVRFLHARTRTFLPPHAPPTAPSPPHTRHTTTLHHYAPGLGAAFSTTRFCGRRTVHRASWTGGLSRFCLPPSSFLPLTGH